MKNLSLQTVAEGVAAACGLIVSMVLSRHLGVNGFGAFNYVFAFTYLLLSLNDLGVNTITLRELAQAPQRAADVIGAALGLRLVIAAAVLVGGLAAIWTWPMDPQLRAPLSLFALMLPLNALNVPVLMLTTTMRFDLLAASTIVSRVGGLLLILAAVAAGGGLGSILGALIVAEVIGVTFIYAHARRMTAIRPRVDRVLWRSLMRSAAPVGTALLLTALVNRIDFMMLEAMLSLEAVGRYSAAYRITAMAEKLPLLMMATLFPIMSQLAITDRDRLRRVYRRAVAHLALIVMPIAAVVTLLAPSLLEFAFGPEYRAAGTALRVLIWATVCLYLALTGGNLLISVGRARDSLWALVLGAGINIVLNLLLIPTYGIVGAAFATAVSFAVILVVTTLAVERVFATAVTGTP